MGITFIPPASNQADRVRIKDVDNHFESGTVEGALKELAEKGGSGSSVEVVDNLTSTDKNKALSANQGKVLNEQYQQIAQDMSVDLIVQNKKIYLKKSDGTTIGTGITVPSGSDLSSLSMSINGQTLKLLDGSTELATVTIPTAVVTDEQLRTIIQGFITDGTLSALTIEDYSINGFKLSNDSGEEIKKRIFKDGGNLLHGVTLHKKKTIDSNGQLIDGNFIITDFIKVESSTQYTAKDISNDKYANAAYWYDASKTFISKSNFFATGTSPTNSVFCRLEIKDYEYLNNGVNWVFAFKDEWVARKNEGVAFKYEIDTEYFKVVEANKLSINTDLSLDLREKIVSNETLEHTLLKNNTDNLFDISKAIIINPTAKIAYVDIKKTEASSYSFTVGTWGVKNISLMNGSKEVIEQLNDPMSPFSISNDNVKYVRVQFSYGNVSSIDKKELMFNEGDILLAYKPFIKNYKIKSNYLPGAKGNKDWSSYKYVAIGDSRTVGYSNNLNDTDGNKIWDVDVAGDYPNFIKYYTNIQLTNKASTGASFCVRTTVTGIPTMFEQALSVTNDTDIITVFGMSNDRVIGVSHPNYNPTNERDNTEDKYDTTTFKGAVRQTIKNIQLQCPSATIIFLVEEDEAYDKGQSKKDMIEEICKLHKIPTLNLTRCAMTGTECNEYLEQKYQNYTDGLHESVVGHKHMAKAVAGEMSKYLW